MGIAAKSPQPTPRPTPSHRIRGSPCLPLMSRNVTFIKPLRRFPGAFALLAFLR
jgi:hypothetical protein